MVIETTRLRLHSASRDEMLRYIEEQTDEILKTAYREMLQGCLDHPDQWEWYSLWMIALQDGTHVGDLSFKGSNDDGSVEIGYGIKEEYQGQGYATEAVNAAVMWALKQPGVTRVEAETEPDNIVSQRVLEKCGFVPSGIIGEEGPRFIRTKYPIPACKGMETKRRDSMKEIRINRVSYSPGYGDMLGGYHENTLKKDKDGSWVYICSDRETHDRPTVTTVYAVSAEAVDQFEEFIKTKKVLSLEGRPKSDLFMTDYSPWGWSIDYDTTAFGKTKREYCGFGEYKRYSADDYALLKELEERFIAMCGEKISETVEENG